eukprot:gene29706-5141_t
MKYTMLSARGVRKQSAITTSSAVNSEADAASLLHPTHISSALAPHPACLPDRLANLRRIVYRPGGTPSRNNHSTLIDFIRGCLAGSGGQLCEFQFDLSDAHTASTRLVQSLRLTPVVLLELLTLHLRGWERLDLPVSPLTRFTTPFSTSPPSLTQPTSTSAQPTPALLPLPTLLTLATGPPPLASSSPSSQLSQPPNQRPATAAPTTSIAHQHPPTTSDTRPLRPTTAAPSSSRYTTVNSPFQQILKALPSTLKHLTLRLSSPQASLTSLPSLPHLVSLTLTNYSGSEAAHAGQLALITTLTSLSLHWSSRAGSSRTAGPPETRDKGPQATGVQSFWAALTGLSQLRSLFLSGGRSQMDPAAIAMAFPQLEVPSGRDQPRVPGAAGTQGSADGSGATFATRFPSLEKLAVSGVSATLLLSIISSSAACSTDGGDTRGGGRLTEIRASSVDARHQPPLEWICELSPHHFPHITSLVIEFMWQMDDSALLDKLHKGIATRLLHLGLLMSGCSVSQGGLLVLAAD